MNNFFCVGVGSLNLTPLDWNGNRNKIESALILFRDQMKQSGMSEDCPGILCLPELALSGPGCQDMFLAKWVCDQAFHTLEALIPHTDNLLVSIGLPVRIGEKTYKGTAIVANCQLLGIHCSQHIAIGGIQYDRRWFSPWHGKSIPTTLYGREVTLGQSVYRFAGTTVAVCELETLTSASASSSLPEANVLLCPAADPFELENDQPRRERLVESSRIGSNLVAFANLVGNESGGLIYDGGSLIAAHGRLVARNNRFTYRDVEVVTVAMQRDGNEIRPAAVQPACDQLEPWERSPDLRFEEFSRAVPLAMFDYMRKCRACGFALSLSGGADSASIAFLIRLLVHFGTLYPEFTEKIRYIPSIAPLAESGTLIEGEKLVESLLVTAYQATSNSSEATRRAAYDVSRAVGSRHYEFNIDRIVDEYISMVAGAIGRKPDWATDDLALQNIQARTRAPGIWLLANLESRLLLSTGNRSEAACGYATMDGDTCGGLAPLAGIDKAFLRLWLKWMEWNGPESFGPSPPLRLVNNQDPTAELRPAQSRQTDESDLMPYPVLNLFETFLIRNRMSAEMALECVMKEGIARNWTYTRDQYSDWLSKFCRQWSGSQWKRERGAPGFHLDDYDLSPGSWCRFPILSNGINGTQE